MDPIDKLVWTWRPVLELGLASKDSFVYLLHFLLLQEQRNIFDNDTCIQPVQRYDNSMQKKPKSWSVTKELLWCELRKSWTSLLKYL